VGTIATSLVAFLTVFGAALFGMLLRRLLPENHLTPKTEDAVKLAMGFVATMAALILGLLVAAAKESFDKHSAGVTQMAAKVIYLDRLLANFGPEANEVRGQYRRVVEQVTHGIWPEQNATPSQLDPSASPTERFFSAIQSLEPKNDFQKTLKDQAVATSLELGQMRWLEYEQAGVPTSNTLIYFLIFWMAVLFTSFSIFAPTNGTVIAAMMLAAMSVAGAVFMILELRSPFVGLIHIPNTQFLDAIQHLGR
jgi:hypothetical protein